MWDRCLSPFLLKTCRDEEIATSLCTLVLLLFYLGSILKSRVFLMQLSLSITMICLLQPNPKVINMVIHSASSSLSSINLRGLTRFFLLEYGFSAFSWLLFVLNYVAKSCTWYLNGEHCKTQVLKGFSIFYFSALFLYLRCSLLPGTGASCYSCHLQVLSLANCLNAKSLHVPPLLWAMILQNPSILEQRKK